MLGSGTENLNFQKLKIIAARVDQLARIDASNKKTQFQKIKIMQDIH